jgi:hypothetical protein
MKRQHRPARERVPVLGGTPSAGAAHKPVSRRALGQRVCVDSNFGYQLKGDAAARAMFVGETCGFCSGSDWTLRRRFPR